MVGRHLVSSPRPHRPVAGIAPLEEEGGNLSRKAHRGACRPQKNWNCHEEYGNRTTEARRHGGPKPGIPEPVFGIFASSPCSQWLRGAFQGIAERYDHWFFQLRSSFTTSPWGRM